MSEICEPNPASAAKPRRTQPLPCKRDPPCTYAMSSHQPKILIDQYSFLSGVVLRELTRPNEEQAKASCIQATTDERNDRDFHIFEATIPSLSLDFDQLNVIVQEQASGNIDGLEEDLEEDPDSGLVTRVEAVFAGWFRWLGSLVRIRLLPIKEQALNALIDSKP